jgi:hypothetical protein
VKRWLTFLALSALLAGVFLYKPILPSFCTLKRVTGLGCPGCGMTRSVISAAHLQVAQAVRWHAFGPFVFAGLVGLWAATLAGLRLRWDHPWTTRVLTGFVVALLVYWGIRLAAGTVP